MNAGLTDATIVWAGPSLHGPAAELTIRWSLVADVDIDHQYRVEHSFAIRSFHLCAINASSIDHHANPSGSARAQQ